MRRLVAASIAMAVVFAIAGCGGDETSLDGTNWTLETIDSGTASSPAIEGTEPTLVFAGTMVSGSDGCNQLSGSVTVGPDDAMSFGPLASTQMACEQPVMDQASAIGEILAGVGTYTIDGSTLTLTAGDGSRLIYTAG